MNIINNILKAFVGDKSQKDVKGIRPLVDKINQHYGSLENLSNDELRAKTISFKEKIKQSRADQDAKIVSYREELEKTTDIDTRETIYSSIDTLEKEAYTLSEKALIDILPEAFAVVKETARRFTNNTELVVTATEQDKLFTETKGYVRVQGNQTTRSEERRVGKECRCRWG